MSHPYRGLPEHQFWSRAVSTVPPHELDPVVSSTLRIGAHDKIATIGSCFAQHVSQYLQRSGMHYFVAEEPEAPLDREAARRLSYGVFSARYGNVYTVRQAVQLFDRAYGAFDPEEPAWARDDSFVDPFRPRIEPDGFSSLGSLHDDRLRHLEAVRRVFSESQILVFTLGLTEGWTSVADGAVFPLAPGVAGGAFDRTRHRFLNFACDDVVDDLIAFAERFHRVNPTGQLVLTVSPVPLIATYEPRHVLVSTVHSKSILRVAAGEVEQRFPFVHYFPSYEIITGPGQADRYFDHDLRQVTEEGVAHVMRVFARHYIDREEPVAPRSASAVALEHRWVDEVVCDEVEIADAQP